MRRLRTQIHLIAPHMRTAFVQVSAGLGEDAIALELHRSGPAYAGPVVSLSASEMNAAVARGGIAAFDSLAEQAVGGSLFVRDAGVLSAELQAMLLDFLRKPAKSGRGVQVVASHPEGLKGLAAAGSFSSELLYRLSSVVIQVPALAERRDDLPVLLMLAVAAIAEEYRRPAPALAEGAMERLVAHSWPGNLLELENVMRQAVLESEHEVISPELIHSLLHEAQPAPEWQPSSNGDGLLRLQEVVDRHVLAAMQRCGGNKLRAAEMLGVSRSTLYRMLDVASGDTSEKSA